MCLAGTTGTGHCHGASRAGVLSPGLAVNVTAMHARLESIGLLRTELARAEQKGPQGPLAPQGQIKEPQDAAIGRVRMVGTSADAMLPGLDVLPGLDTTLSLPLSERRGAVLDALVRHHVRHAHGSA